MAIEARRKCGYRKVGGLYLCSDGFGMTCCKMPIPFHICPTCNTGVKQTRGWQWIDPRPWLKSPCMRQTLNCPASNLELLGERVGLLWIGEQFYPTPQVFTQEAIAMGMSRRVKAIPRGYKIGETWVFLAHPKVREATDPVTGEVSWEGGVFQIVRPTRWEKIVTETESEDEDEMERLRQVSITPVIVPDKDKDHIGSVFDKQEPQEEMFI